MIKAYLLYTTPEGDSCVRAGRVSESLLTNVKEISFKETSSGSVYDWHPAPTTQYVLTLSGELEFTTSQGKIFVLKAGDVLIATDTTGKGHKWRMLGDKSWKRAYVKFDEAMKINFIED